MRSFILLAIAMLMPNTLVAQDIPRGAQVAPEFRLKGDVVSLPFVLVKEFPFVEVEVNGVKGKFLLDTGAHEALALNQNPLKLPEGRVVGRGAFGSGQTYVKVLRPSVDNIRLPGGLTYDHVTTFLSQDAKQLEHITPDFLGWLGYWFWDGYAVKFDYKAAKATFYKGGSKAFLQGETVIAALPFTTPKLPNDPVLTARIGDADFETILDTGQYGRLFADTATIGQLTSAGAITPVANEEREVDVKALRFSQGPAIALSGLPTYPIEATSPFATAIGVTSPRIMSLGYVLLKQFKTVWDYPNKVIYLLKP